MKKALITGITGQDGSYLAELLLEKGYEVHGLIRRSASINTWRIEHLYNDKNILDKKLFLHYGDLTDAISLTNLLQKIKPDEIYNLAAQSHVKISFEIPEITANIDALGTLKLLEAIKILDPKLLKHIPGNGDQATGVNILRKALEAPTRKLAENAGVNGDVVIENINKKEAGYGYNVLTDSYVDMVKAGIIDPAKVTRSAVENAVSVANMILTTESLIVDDPDEKNPPAGGPAMPPGGMDY